MTGQGVRSSSLTPVLHIKPPALIWGNLKLVRHGCEMLWAFEVTRVLISQPAALLILFHHLWFVPGSRLDHAIKSDCCHHYRPGANCLYWFAGAAPPALCITGIHCVQAKTSVVRALQGRTALYSIVSCKVNDVPFKLQPFEHVCVCVSVCVCACVGVWVWVCGCACACAVGCQHTGLLGLQVFNIQGYQSRRLPTYKPSKLQVANIQGHEGCSSMRAACCQRTGPWGLQVANMQGFWVFQVANIQGSEGCRVFHIPVTRLWGL